MHAIVEMYCASIAALFFWTDLRQENMHDLLLPRGRSIYHQIMEKFVPLLEKALW